MKSKVLNYSLTVLFGIAIFLFIITVSIGLPIYLRFFYYMQINPLGLPESTGKTYEQIKQAYDQVLNYLTLPNCEFGTGVFAHTAEGASHFADCKVLFDLNLSVMIISLSVIITLFILKRYKLIKLAGPFGMDVSFISAVSIFAVIVVLAILICIDFDYAFIVFHNIFFAGKDNWTFNPYTDQIINILPAQFFLNCAIFIGVGIVLISLSIIAFQLIKRHKTAKNDRNCKNSLTDTQK